MKYISQTQLTEAIRRLADFRSHVSKQAAQHILPFLALRRKGVSTQNFSLYAESDDFDFFDNYVRIHQGDRPYFDPIAGLFRIATHPHSNIATARKGTFYRSWGAATSRTERQGESWKLTPEYVDIIRKKVLTKGKAITLIPAIPLGTFLFRQESFPDDATPIDIGRRLKSEFKISDLDYSSLFEETTTVGTNFSSQKLGEPEILAAISASEVTIAREYQSLTIKDDDPVLSMVKAAITDDEYAGVIFLGPPGTGKSWYANQIALALTDEDHERIQKVQFHPSFQYENFVQGFVPVAGGNGFTLADQVMLKLIEAATNNSTEMFVMVIDELNRADPTRVFGELLTYIEPARRGEVFTLAYGKKVAMPPNIAFIATMNSRDKNVVDMDDAFDRRFAKLDFPPNSEVLNFFLQNNGVPEDLRRRVESFFTWVQPFYPLGHTYFRLVRDQESLLRLWQTQLRFLLAKHYRYDQDTLNEIQGRFTQITGVGVE